MITSADVHLAIQEMNNDRPQHDRAIEVSTIATSCHMGAEDMGMHISVLCQLNYLNFTDLAKKKIRLTASGKYTLVPHQTSA